MLFSALAHSVDLLLYCSFSPSFFSHSFLFIFSSQAADEYLTLLPECLPFLSELMEDSSRDVVAGTSEAIKFIEELSGEKLDSYLQ